jgi:hypothetical protein
VKRDVEECRGIEVDARKVNVDESSKSKCSLWIMKVDIRWASTRSRERKIEAHSSTIKSISGNSAADQIVETTSPF